MANLEEQTIRNGNETTIYTNRIPEGLLLGRSKRIEHGKVVRILVKHYRFFDKNRGELNGYKIKEWRR